MGGPKALGIPAWHPVTIVDGPSKDGYYSVSFTKWNKKYLGHVKKKNVFEGECTNDIFVAQRPDERKPCPRGCDVPAVIPGKVPQELSYDACPLCKGAGRVQASKPCTFRKKNQPTILEEFDQLVGKNRKRSRAASLSGERRKVRRKSK